ncbi:hypothetical protein J3F83DRAFT_747071 [Trichoderma novae-zelandiae]
MTELLVQMRMMIVMIGFGYSYLTRPSEKGQDSLCVIARQLISQLTSRQTKHTLLFPKHTENRAFYVSQLSIPCACALTGHSRNTRCPTPEAHCKRWAARIHVLYICTRRENMMLRVVQPAALFWFCLLSVVQTKTRHAAAKPRTSSYGAGNQGTLLVLVRAKRPKRLPNRALQSPPRSNSNCRCNEERRLLSATSTVSRTVKHVVIPRPRIREGGRVAISRP